MRTLENETKELKEYQHWDRERRALEYTIYDRELKETRKKLEEIQARREQSSESTAEIRRAAKDCADQIEVWLHVPLLVIFRFLCIHFAFWFSATLGLIRSFWWKMF